MRNVERAQFAGAQPAAIQQQDNQSIASCCGPGRGGRLHQPLGLFQVESLRFRTPQGMLQAEAIEHVAFGAATAPGVLEQSADVAEILGQAAFSAATLALGFEPMQIILQRKMP